MGNLVTVASMIIKKKMDKKNMTLRKGSLHSRTKGHLYDRSLSVSSYIPSATPQHRTFLTVCMYACFLALGLEGSVMGPTLVHMQHLFDADLQEITLTFTYQRVGYLVGVALSGFLFDRLNQELQFAIACLIEGIATALAPWMPTLYGYYGAMVLQALAHGYINTGGQSFIFGLWEDHRHKQPVIQGGNAFWSLGASICPFIVSPFLVSLPADTDIVTASTIVTSEILNTTSSPLDSVNSTQHENKSVETLTNLGNVRYAYFIVGMGIAVISILFFIAFFLSGPSCDNNGVTVTQEKPKLHGDSYSFKIPMLVMLYLFFVFYVWYEGVTGGLISAFVIEGLKWTVHKGPLITSVYWGAHGLGRLLGIPISMCLSAATMLVCNLTLTMASFIVMYFATMADTDVFMWLSAAMAGFSMATTFACMLLWVSDHMTITGAAGSVFLMGTSTGGMTGAAIVGHLFQTQTHMWVVYLSLLSCAAHIVLFTIMYTFTYCHKCKSQSQHKSKPSDSHKELEQLSSSENSESVSIDMSNSQQSCVTTCVHPTPCNCLDFQLRQANSNVM